LSAAGLARLLLRSEPGADPAQRNMAAAGDPGSKAP